MTTGRERIVCALAKLFNCKGACNIPRNQAFAGNRRVSGAYARRLTQAFVTVRFDKLVMWLSRNCNRPGGSWSGQRGDALRFGGSLKELFSKKAVAEPEKSHD